MSTAQPQLIRKFFRDHIEVIAITLLIAVCLRFFVIGAYRVPNSNMLPTLRAGDFVFGFRLPYGLRLPVLGTRLATDHLPHRGDLVVFQIRDESLESYTLLQRVIGLPGDRIEVQKGRVILNGAALDYAATANVEKLVLPNGHVEMTENLDGRTHTVILPPATSSSLVLIEKLKEEKAKEEKTKTKKTKSREPAPEVVNSGDQEPLVVPPHSIYLLGDDRSLSDDSRQFGTVLSSDVEAQAFLIWLSLDWQDSGLPSVRWDRVLRQIE